MMKIGDEVWIKPEARLGKIEGVMQGSSIDTKPSYYVQWQEAQASYSGWYVENQLRKVI